MEENPDELCHTANDLGRLGVPAFMFQEGDNQQVESVYREIARLTHGAYCRFNPGAARQLAELLRAVAVYAVGGMTALLLGMLMARSNCSSRSNRLLHSAPPTAIKKRRQRARLHLWVGGGYW